MAVSIVAVSFAVVSVVAVSIVVVSLVAVPLVTVPGVNVFIGGRLIDRAFIGVHCRGGRYIVDMQFLR